VSPIELGATALAALVIGLLIGTIGIGGVLLTPWLTQVMDVPVRDAIMISSFAFIATGVAAIVVAARSPRDGDASAVDWRLVIATVPGALAGAWALSLIPSRLALALLACLTGWVGLRVLLARRAAVHDATDARSDRSLPLGFATGFASALTGTGGPMVLTPLLLWQGVPMLAAILLGQLVQLPIAITASAGNLLLGEVDVRTASAIGFLLLPGALLGRRVARALPLVALSRVVGVTLVAAAVSFAARALGR
jgi:uncharacterized membrane protein YfcA